MADAIHFLNALSNSMYNGLNSVNVPVLNISFLAFAFAVLFINVLLWVIRVITGGRQDSQSTGRNALDDNNNYIYRR